MPESYSQPRRAAGGRATGYLATVTYRVVGYFARDPRRPVTESNREYTLDEVVDSVRRELETHTAAGGDGPCEDVVIWQGDRVTAVLRRGEDGRLSPVPVG